MQVVATSQKTDRKHKTRCRRAVESTNARCRVGEQLAYVEQRPVLRQHGTLEALPSLYTLAHIR